MMVWQDLPYLKYLMRCWVTLYICNWKLSPIGELCILWAVAQLRKTLTNIIVYWTNVERIDCWLNIGTGIKICRFCWIKVTFKYKYAVSFSYSFYPSIFRFVGSFPSLFVASHYFNYFITVSSCVTQCQCKEYALELPCFMLQWFMHNERLTDQYCLSIPASNQTAKINDATNLT
jgi:hypothetical protein